MLCSTPGGISKGSPNASNTTAAPTKSTLSMCFLMRCTPLVSTEMGRLLGRYVLCMYIYPRPQKSNSCSRVCSWDILEYRRTGAGPQRTFGRCPSPLRPVSTIGRRDRRAQLIVSRSFAPKIRLATRRCGSEKSVGQPIAHKVRSCRKSCVSLLLACR